MDPIKNTTQPEPDPASQETPEKVTTGDEGKSAENPDPAASQGGEEHTPATETSKEEMTGYNELPEQEKVGGG